MLAEMNNLPEIITAFATLAALFSGAVAWYSRRLLRKHRHESDLAANIIEHLNEGFYRSTLDGKQLFANPALVRLNGYESEAELLTSVEDISTEWYVEPKRREEFKQLLFERGRINGFVSEIYRHKTRERIWISESARLVCDPSTGEPLYYEGTVREITDEVKHAAIQTRLSKLADNLPGGLFQLVRHKDKRFSVPYLSDSFLKIAGFDGAVGLDDPNSFLNTIHPEDLPRYLMTLKESGQQLKPINQQFRWRIGSGEVKWIHMTSTPERMEDGAIIWHGHINDITAQKEIELKIEQLAYFDSLTGLPKRTVIEDRLIATIGACNRHDNHAALLFLDLDNFKPLNDAYGHEMGDQLLRQVGLRLKQLTRGDDIVARYGGDEFVILIDHIGDDMDQAMIKAGAFGEKIIDAFQQCFQLGDREHQATPSIGITIIDGSMPSADEVVRRADAAMYRAKKTGRNRWALHEPLESTTHTGAHEMQKELQTAAEQGEFQLVFQPQMDSRKKITGAEAFLRWNHPRLGLLMPSDFVPHAERNGMMGKIDDWVMRTGLHALRVWKSEPSLVDLTLSINVSEQQFAADNFPERLKTQLAEIDCKPGSLILELPENIINRNLHSVSARMRALKEAGVRLSLDDFGTGNTSLSNLNQLPFDEIKIDGAFVSSLGENAGNRSMIEGILGVAKGLELDTVAEHVSSTAQENYLLERGCNRFQGYHYHPPLAENVFMELAKRNRFRPRLLAAG